MRLVGLKSVWSHRYVVTMWEETYLKKKKKVVIYWRMFADYLGGGWLKNCWGDVNWNEKHGNWADGSSGKLNNMIKIMFMIIITMMTTLSGKPNIMIIIKMMKDASISSLPCFLSAKVNIDFSLWSRSVCCKTLPLISLFKIKFGQMSYNIAT